ncbi:hypothetical protein PGT21_013376 [Puccinia graminis f. sp. tritici]|uniref:Uncharacterized protein n=2 Tax=Puccinia graminis f. sp. tritici TaxID=56615 RepID=E3KS06_PUCGT|nr:uncharacterized protein PGTG_13300 [Puccinia graminis f. sp. tritici CRL 75-36-700-3]EFP87081.2 hypothetical protein PGTG_13300 [Puccinia graminis f. sp. tritici CRL 75-36-700-3]KAA1076615.1 hypothetical protein PGT21_013376 [Puccinia graminis f. sp. tritici]KAA1126783.1 hypothetical protein PGTUg99_019890 [Puccinia graminis f. sp. tritici]
MIAPRVSFGLERARQAIKWQKTMMISFIVILHCAPFTNLAPLPNSENQENPSGVIQTVETLGRTVGGLKDDAKSSAVWHDSKHLKGDDLKYFASDSVSQSRGVDDHPPSTGYIYWPHYFHVKRPTVTHQELLARDDLLTKSIHNNPNFEALDREHARIQASLLKQAEGIELLQIEWKDRLVREFKKGGTHTGLRRLRQVITKETQGQLRTELLEDVKLAEQDFELKGWWFKLVNFFLYLFEREKWRKENISMKLSKLRRNFQNSKALSNDNEWTAINRLSILESRGFDFSDRQAQLIENMSAGNSQLTSDDKSLITEISCQTVTQRQLMRIESLKESYSATTEGEPTHKMMVKIVEALDQLQENIRQGEVWHKSEIELLSTMETLKDVHEFSSVNGLNLDRKTKRVLRNLLVERNKSEQKSSRMKAFSILDMDLKLSLHEELVLDKLREHKINPKPDLTPGQKETIKDRANEYDIQLERIREFHKNTHLIETARNHLQDREKFENPSSQALSERTRYGYAYKALQAMKTRGITLTAKEETLLDQLKSASKLEDLDKNEIEKFAIEHILIKKINNCHYLRIIANQLAHSNAEFLVPQNEKNKEFPIIFKNEELEEISRLRTLSRDDNDDQEFLNATKFVKILTILNRVDYRAKLTRFELENPKSIRIQQAIHKNKNNRLEACKAEFLKMQAIPSEFQRITNFLIDALQVKCK